MNLLNQSELEAGPRPVDSALPALAECRRPYGVPQLERFGALHVLTRTVGFMGTLRDRAGGIINKTR